MGTRRLFLIFSILILIVILFAMMDLVPSPSTERIYGAYFTKVKYPEEAPQEKNVFLIFVVYNKNCTTIGEDSGSFFLKFYVDDDLWWNEYNNTDYQIWSCDRENSTVRAYIMSLWYSMKPRIHDVKVELYWYDGNEPHLQDIAYFSLTVLVYATPTNLIIFSYLIVYLLAIALLGFYMLNAGRIQISSEPQKANFAFHRQSARVVSFLPKFSSKHFFLCFYSFIFASWQIINALVYMFSFTERLGGYLFLMAQIFYTTLLVLVIKKENSSFSEYGYSWPEETDKYILSCLLPAISYGVITIFVPGSFTGYYLFPSESSTEIFLMILLAFAASVTTETIFRGYIQGRLTKMIGFPRALFATSLMFALFATPLLPLNLFGFLPEVLSLFVLGVFLGVLFYRTKTLLCPILFYFIILILKPLTPIEAVSSQYAELFLGLVALAFASLLLSLFIVKSNNVVSSGD